MVSTVPQPDVFTTLFASTFRAHIQFSQAKSNSAALLKKMSASTNKRKVLACMPEMMTFMAALAVHNNGKFQQT